MDFFSRHGLPSNSALASLPPLPKTPFHPSRPFSPDFDADLEDPLPLGHPSIAAYTPAKTPGQTRERMISPWKETVYPVLTARQGGMNVARSRTAATPARGREEVCATVTSWKTPSHRVDENAGRETVRRSPIDAIRPVSEPGTAKHVIEKVAIPAPSSPLLPSNRQDTSDILDMSGASSFDASLDFHSVTASPLPSIVQPRQQPPATPLRTSHVIDSPGTAAKVHAATPRTGGMMRSAALSSMRKFDLSLEGAASPSKPSGRTHSAVEITGPSSMASESHHNLRRGDIVPSTVASLSDSESSIGDTAALTDAAGSPASADPAGPATRIAAAESVNSTLRPTSSHEWAQAEQTNLLTEPGIEIDASLLLPVSPRRNQHALASALDQSTLLPSSPYKWAQAEESMLISEMLPPMDGSIRLPGSNRPKPSARETLDQSTLLPTSPHKWAQVDHTLLVKQALPRPSFGNDSLLLPVSPRPHQRGTPATRVDQSILLPSPRKLGAIPDDQSMIMAAELDDMDESMRLTLPRAPAGGKTPRQALMPDSFAPLKGADETLDIGAMLAGLKKPKRASGTEESFADLLHGDLSGDMDQSMFIPADLRPALPRSLSAKTLPRDEGKNRRRLNSLSDIPPVKATAIRQFAPAKAMSPSKPDLQQDSPIRRACTVAKSRPTSIVPPSRLARPPTLTAPTARSRISLSAGPLPMPSSASIRRVDTLSGPIARATAGRAAMPPPTSSAVAVRPTRTSMIPPTTTRTTLTRPRGSIAPPPTTCAAPAATAGSRFSSAPQRSVNTATSTAVGRAVSTKTSMPPPALPSTSAPRASALPRPATRPAVPVSTTTSRLPGAAGTNLASRSRAFATDAAPAVNRLSRLPTNSSLLPKSDDTKPQHSRLSAAPGTKITSTVMKPPSTLPAIKTRNLSTPASTVAAVQSSTTSRLTRPSSIVGPSAASTTVRPAAMRPASMVGPRTISGTESGAAQKLRTGSTQSLATSRPASRVPSGAAAGASVGGAVRDKRSAPPAGAGTAAGGKSRVQEIEVLREKIKAMQARQTARTSKAD